MTGVSLYERDILAWCSEQSHALATLAGQNPSSDIDWPNIVATIKAVGRAEFADVVCDARGMLGCIIKGYCDPDSLSRNRWSIEMLRFQLDLTRRLEPSMRHEIHLDALWSEAFDLAIPSVRDEILTVPPGIPAACPFTLDDLLDEEFTYETAVKRLYDRLDALTEDRSP